MRILAPAAAAVCMVWAVACATSAAQGQMAQPPQSASSSAQNPTPVPSPGIPLFVGSSALIPGWSLSFSPYVWAPSVSAKINTPTPGGGVATTDIFVPSPTTSTTSVSARCWPARRDMIDFLS